MTAEPKTGLSTSPDSPLPPIGSIDDDVASIPSWRKWVILFVVCWMPLPMTFWSTAIMPATIEVASDLNIPVTTINTINAGVFVAQALSGLIWLPVSTIIGRKSAYLAANAVLCVCAIGCATVPNLPGFAALWILGGNTGPFFLVAGQTILADIFDPVGTLKHWKLFTDGYRRLVGLLLGSFWGVAFLSIQSVSQPDLVIVTLLRL
jgi:MFS family permease